jgi:hypothetical protein
MRISIISWRQRVSTYLNSPAIQTGKTIAPFDQDRDPLILFPFRIIGRIETRHLGYKVW